MFAKYTPIFQEVYEPGYEAERDEFVGKWRYRANGGRIYEREFLDDGTVRLYEDGVWTGWFKGASWEYKGNGLIECRDANGALFGKHTLKDADTLIFVTEPWGEAKRAGGEGEI